jgi:hypothetical protein
MTNSAVSSIAPSEVDWVGTLEPQYYGQYFDYGMLLVFGGIPWQVSEREQCGLTPFNNFPFLVTLTSLALK